MFFEPATDTKPKENCSVARDSGLSQMFELIVSASERTLNNINMLVR